MIIPVDEACPLSSYRVYIHPDTSIIYDASLNQTNSSKNNNKFCRLQLLESPQGQYRTWTRWGRVGEVGQNKILGDGSLYDALAQFQAKFREKSGLNWEDRASTPKAGKYVFLEKSYEPDLDDEQSPAQADAGASSAPNRSALHPSVRSLMELIFNEQYFAETMRTLNYDSKKLPLGKLSKATITRGFQALKDLAAVLEEHGDNADGAEVERLSNLYYSLIPHIFGCREGAPVIKNMIILRKEIEVLESLDDLKQASDLMNLKDTIDSGIPTSEKRFNSLGLSEMTPLQKDSPEFNELSQYLFKTRGSTHSFNYTVEDIFRVERNGERDRFEDSRFAKMQSDKRLLWHGSRVTNFAGILSQDLRIAPPEAPPSGYMFGKGIYLADMSSKSAQYCFSYNSGGYGLLLLCEAEFGNPMQIMQKFDYNAASKADLQGMHSTWGQGQMGPKAWKDAFCVHPALAGVKMPDTSIAPEATGYRDSTLLYNEYIAYDIAQVRIRYLFRVRM